MLLSPTDSPQKPVEGKPEFLKQGFPEVFFEAWKPFRVEVAVRGTELLDAFDVVRLERFLGVPVKKEEHFRPGPAAFQKLAFDKSAFSFDEFRVRKKYGSLGVKERRAGKSLFAQKDAGPHFQSLDRIVKVFAFGLVEKPLAKRRNGLCLEIQKKRLQMRRKLVVFRERYDIRGAFFRHVEECEKAVLEIDYGIVYQHEPFPFLAAELCRILDVALPHAKIVAAVFGKEKFDAV